MSLKRQLLIDVSSQKRQRFIASKRDRFNFEYLKSLRNSKSSMKRSRNDVAEVSSKRICEDFLSKMKFTDSPIDKETKVTEIPEIHETKVPEISEVPEEPIPEELEKPIVKNARQPNHCNYFTPHESHMSLKDLISGMLAAQKFLILAKKDVCENMFDLQACYADANYEVQDSVQRNNILLLTLCSQTQKLQDHLQEFQNSTNHILQWNREILGITELQNKE